MRAKILLKNKFSNKIQLFMGIILLYKGINYAYIVLSYITCFF